MNMGCWGLCISMSDLPPGLKTTTKTSINFLLFIYVFLWFLPGGKTNLRVRHAYCNPQGCP